MSYAVIRTLAPRSVPPGIMPGLAPAVPPGIMPRVPPGIAPRVPPGIRPVHSGTVPPGIMPRVPPGIMPRVPPGIMPRVPPGIRPVAGLGKVFTAALDTPFGNKNFSVNVPYEQLAQDAVGYTVSEFEKYLPELLDKALKQTSQYVLEQFWPTMKPTLRAEVDRAIDAAKLEADKAVDKATRNAAFIATGIIIGVFGAGAWVRASRKA